MNQNIDKVGDENLSESGSISSTNSFMLTNVHTTAGGDGLSFTPGVPTIFDWVENLKKGVDLMDEEHLRRRL